MQIKTVEKQPLSKKKVTHPHATNTNELIKPPQKRPLPSKKKKKKKKNFLGKNKN